MSARLEGWGGPPISGKPEIGILSAQVGYSRLAIFETRLTALLSMRPIEAVGRLMEFLTALGQDVRITVKPTRKRVAEMEVVS